jgi:outer membrane protein assembly factor BamB
MTRYFIIATAIAAAGAPSVRAQGRGGGDWSTGGGDAQRSSWVRTDAKISPESIAKPGFQVAWKVKLPNEARQGNAVFAPVLLERYIGYRGFRSFAFAGGSSENVFAVDTDLGRVEWQKHFRVETAAGTATCPGGMTAASTEPALAALPAMNDGRGGRAGGRGGPARSGVGAPLEGAVTIAASMAAAANPAAGGGRGRGAIIPGAPGAPAVPGPRGRMPSMVYALSGDGAFHAMYVSNGDEPEPPVKFLPAHANAKDLMLVDNVAYAVTVNNCGGVPNGIWALDVASKSVANWSGNGVGAAIGPDGIYVTTADGDLVLLEAKTLAKKASYSGGAAFSTAPVLFESKGKIMLAAATKDGNLHLADAATMTGTGAKTGLSADALSTWQDSTGTRWLLAAGAKSVGAWKVGDTLQPGWTSREIASPLTPIVVNGVVFAVAGGSRSSRAVMYALDGFTGKELWNSGNAITSFAPRSAGLAAGGSQIYLGTSDGTLWAFAFPIEH